MIKMETNTDRIKSRIQDRKEDRMVSGGLDVTQTAVGGPSGAFSSRSLEASVTWICTST